MAKPGVLCHLKKGKLIDTQEGFVDTFNWMVDYINNLRGDDNNIEIANPTGVNPVVKFVGDIPEGGGGGGSLEVTAIDVESGTPTTLSAVNNLTFQSAEDSAVTLELASDGEVNTLTIGVHYAD